MVTKLPVIHSCSSTFLYSLLNVSLLIRTRASGEENKGNKESHFFLQQESDKITTLPRQAINIPPVSLFSGYITVNKKNGRAQFYWFFEAQSQPSQKPLLLWLNGGPGCSSIGYGAAVELGPLRVKRNGTGLEFNRCVWNNVNWMKRFPQYQAHEFYIAGESYKGHYVPQFAELVYDRNKDRKNYPNINFKGFILGNPETEDYYDTKGLVEHAWNHTEYKEIDIYNIYASKCYSSNASSSLSSSSSFNADAHTYSSYMEG